MDGRAVCLFDSPHHAASGCLRHHCRCDWLGGARLDGTACSTVRPGLFRRPMFRSIRFLRAMAAMFRELPPRDQFLWPESTIKSAYPLPDRMWSLLANHDGPPDILPRCACFRSLLRSALLYDSKHFCAWKMVHATWQHRISGETHHGRQIQRSLLAVLTV